MAKESNFIHVVEFSLDERFPKYYQFILTLMKEWLINVKIV